MPEYCWSVFAETLSNTQASLLRKLFEFKVVRVNLDFDQIMCASETPVVEEFFRQTGLDYRGSPIDRWLALSHRAAREGSMSFEEAAVIEKPIWENPSVLMKAMPILEIQRYSERAHENGVIQTIVSTRIPGLREQTLDWIKIHYPWIPLDSVYIRGGLKTPKNVFKGIIIDALGAEVHLEDAVDSAQAVLSYSDASVILFPRSSERGSFSGEERVIEIPDMSLWKNVYNA